MGLEAEGSNPSIYPIFSTWSVEVNKTNVPITQTNWTLIYLTFLKKSLPDLFITKYGQQRHILFNARNLHKNQAYPNLSKNPIYHSLLTSEFKSNYRYGMSLKKPGNYNLHKAFFLPQKHNDLRLLNSFRSYLRINSASQSILTTPHHSFQNFYLGYRKGGLAILNVNKFYNRWKDVYYLIFNLFYYEIELLTFGTSLFRSEVLSLNWQSMNKFKFMWRYTKPFLSFRPNKITTYGDFVFYRLNLLGLRLALVVDVLYHNKTIYYLHRSGFYSIGLVPVNYNIASVNFAIPSAADSLLSQVFFIRFLSLTQQDSTHLKYTSSKNMWYSENYLS